MGYSEEDCIILIKWAAACSKTTQPADVMKSFLIIRQFLAGRKFQYSCADDSVPRPAWMGTVERILQPMPAASRRVFLKFFHHLPNIAGSAYTPAICAAGFSIPGIYGLNIKQAMNMYPGWEILGEADQNYVLEQIVEMSILQGHDGTTLDDLMVSRLGHIFGSIECSTGEQCDDEDSSSSSSSDDDANNLSSKKSSKKISTKKS